MGLGGFVYVLVGLICPLLIVGTQIFVWLRLGYWQEAALVHFGLTPFRTGWLGVDRMIDWVYTAPPAALFIFIVATAVLLIVDEAMKI